MPELRQRDDNGQAVDKAQHHRVRHHADQLAKPCHREQQLQQAHQHDRGKQVLHPVLHHQRHHDHGQRAGGTRDHARPAAEGGCHEGHDAGGVQARQWRHMRNQRKGDGLRHHGQGDREAAEQVGADDGWRGQAGQVGLRGLAATGWPPPDGARHRVPAVGSKVQRQDRGTVRTAAMLRCSILRKSSAHVHDRAAHRSTDQASSAPCSTT